MRYLWDGFFNYKYFRKKDIEVSKYVALCALDIICETSMGKCVNAQIEAESEYVKAVYRINDIIQNRQKNPLVWNNLTFKLFGEGKDHEWALNILHGFTRKVIQERRAELTNERYADTSKLAFLDLLLTMEDKDQISAEDIQQEVELYHFVQKFYIFFYRLILLCSKDMIQHPPVLVGHYIY